MKSRIVFMLTLATFFNPIAVMAEESKVIGSSIACMDWAKGKILENSRTTAEVTVNADGKPVLKSSAAH